MRKFFNVLAPALLLMLAACDTGPMTEETAATGETIATVNGKAITQEQFDTYAERRTGTAAEMLEPQVREQLVNELVNIELLVQAALEKNLHEQPPLKAQLAFQRDTALADAAMTQYLEQNPIVEEDIRAEYEKRQAELGGTEYKARHILVESEEKARELIQQLEGGADFAELAKQHSTEPGADQSGGDLGWFSASQMVPPFSAAVTSMQPGEHSKEPVETQFGWHVILLEDTREVAPPAFEQVAPRIQRVLMNQRIQDYINELREKAKISGVETVTEDAAAKENGSEAAPEDDANAGAEEATPEA